ncbi:MAG: hypothetical protein A3F84_02665 [Candidatus Handelsmanbacteria bacterium RIFCSPLOWO2_12_FULL_64_10]|uniref:Uncharacterized protein n=1 Tax=Handelsmanbacteria sp. (strain RIFCSPLOWO2_12_FULL_64_10) TaxID=1817868 RepID=A0A1F6CLH8_HANXR|nr:MAG: hypothetical protein A3F84_02665 [Candidatus Handelsmanbacteria bacterium RIFCSPLOWO2_12_FULL_64_10]
MTTFYMKSEGLDGVPILHIRRLDAQGNYILGQANVEHLGIYHPGWVRCQHTFQTLPGTVRGELMLHVVYGKLQGKIWIDDLSIRELPQPEQVPVQGRVSPGRDGGELQAEWGGVRLDATIRGLSDRIAVEGVLRDTTGKDRCVQLTWRLPLAARGWRWYTGLDSFHVIEPGGAYTNAAEIGRDTNRYISPWPYSSLDGPEVGLSLGAPMDHPSVYRMCYDEEGYYTIRIDFGLSPDTKKFPGQARFALVLSRHDPRWGMRAAAKRYFTMSPQFFEARTRPGATAQTALIAQIRGLDDFGVMYGDRHGGDVRWIKSTHDAGMYAMSYNEPWMWRSRFGPMAQVALPLAEEIVAREQRDIDAWDRNDTSDYWGTSRAYSVRAFLNSVFHDESGQPVMNGTRTYSAGRVVEWLTSADPEIVGSYGDPNRGMLSWTYEYEKDAEGARRLGGVASGIRYDSLEEWAHLGAENFRREHFAFADLPLTFSYRTGRPCQLGYFCALEYMTFVRREMLRQNGITYANGAVSVPWFAHLLDGISREGWSPEMRGYQRIRMLMYRKTCGDWGGIRWRLSDAEIERRLNTCLTYAWWPGIDGAPQETFDRKRPIFKKYIPALRALAQAGWEPVTHAVAKPEGAVIERFGGEGGRRLFFTVRNPEQGPQDISVTVDVRALGLPADRLRVLDALAGEEIAPLKGDEAGERSFSLKVPAQTTAALEVKDRE